MSGDKTGCEISAPASASLSSQTVSLPDPAAAAQTLYSPHTLSFFLLLLLLLLDFHLFSTSLVSLLSCHFAVGGQWLGARCVLGQLPPALHKRHANCRCGLLAAAKRGVLRPTLWEQTPQLFFAHNYLTSSQSVRNSMFFSDTKTSPWANCVAKAELFFCADTFRPKQMRLRKIPTRNRSCKRTAGELHTYFECRRAQTTRWVTESPPVIICSRDRR